MNIVLVQENMYMNSFRKKGATSIDNAKTLEELGCRHNFALKKLVGKGVLIKTDNKKYYMDEEKAEEFLYSRRKFSFYMMIILFLIILFITLKKNI